MSGLEPSGNSERSLGVGAGTFGREKDASPPSLLVSTRTFQTLGQFFVAQSRSPSDHPSKAISGADMETFLCAWQLDSTNCLSFYFHTSPNYQRHTHALVCFVQTHPTQFFCPTEYSTWRSLVRDMYDWNCIDLFVCDCCDDDDVAQVLAKL